MNFESESESNHGESVRVAESEKVKYYAAMMTCKDHCFGNTTVVFQDILSERSKEPR